LNRTEPAKTTDYLAVAQVSSLGGDTGFVKLKLFTDFTDDLRKRKVLYIDFFGQKKELKIDTIRGNGKQMSVKFSGFSSAEEAKVLLGRNLFIPAGETRSLSENEYYVHDLIGSDVYKNDIFFGKIKDVFSLPTNDVYVIEKSSGEEYLLPALKEYIESFSAAEKKLTLKRGEGFYDDEN